MEYLEFSGKKYVKVSSAARETGYTSDYIGQLCRARKIDAKLVGRTWYVAQDEIHSHRRTKGRSSQEKVRQNLKEQIQSNQQEVSIPVRVAHTPLRHRNLLDAQVSYHHDDSDLIPLAAAASHVEVKSQEVETAISLDTGEHHVSIDDADAPKEPSTFAPAAKSEIKWNGTIVVEPLETEKQTPESSTRSTTALERHIKIRDDNGRNIKPNLVISDVSNDPLETKKRFLERMNLAHALNDAPSQRGISKPRGTIATAPRRTPVSQLREKLVPVIDNPVVSSVSAEKRPVRFLGLTTASVALVSLGFLLLSAFVQTETEYRAPSGNGAKAVYFSSVRLSSPQKALELLSDRMNEAMVAVPMLKQK